MSTNTGSSGAEMVEELIVAVADTISCGEEVGRGEPSGRPFGSVCHYFRSDALFYGIQDTSEIGLHMPVV